MGGRNILNGGPEVPAPMKQRRAFAHPYVIIAIMAVIIIILLILLFL